MEEGIKSIPDIVAEKFGVKTVDPATLSPLTMAFVGDAVYSIIIRTLVVCRGNTKSSRLHDMTSRLVSAKGQCMVADKWESEELLSEKEREIFRRGVNASPKSQAKNATTYQYHRATGVETLAGYLYLSGQEERLTDLIRAGIE